MVKINRKIEPGRYKISDVFPSIQNDRMMLEIFGSMNIINEVLEKIHINLVDFPHYMNVNNDDGTINVGLGHLRNSEPEVLYLDILHELYHVKQHREGTDLYPQGIAYVDRQTEIEAYQFAVTAARKIGLTDKDILDYLWVEWISPRDNAKLAKRLNVTVEG